MSHYIFNSMMKQNFPLKIVLKKITKFQWFAAISICFTHKNAKADILHPVACLIYLRMEKWGCLMPSFHSGSWWCLASGMHIFSSRDLLTVFLLRSAFMVSQSPRLHYLKSHSALCYWKLLWENGVHSSFHMSLIVDSVINKRFI